MNQENNVRLIVTKSALWFIVGCAMAVAAARYLRGLGATTALTDTNPWGLWVGFDVLSGVALAAGGFVIAAAVYIFHLDRYHGLVRPAVLTAFLGYIAVVLGLLVDLGRPWNIWRMIFFWQPHSPLFEVGWCVMLYLTVLLLEFIPVVFEGLKWNRAFAFMRRLTLPLVIIGIGLSSLHQSSLGSLFLLAEDRMHPLWYSPILPLLFLVSAIGLGLAMVTVESCSTSWLYRREAEWPLLGGLTRAASVVLLLYLALRIGDLAARGQLHWVVSGSFPAALFLVEISLSVVIPVLLFTLPATRNRHGAIAAGAFCAVAGFVLHRADVGGISHISITGEIYLPALTELLVSAGVVAGMALVFLFFVERFPVWETPPEVPGHFTRPVADPASRVLFGGPWFGRAHLAAIGWVIGVVAGGVVLETTTHGGGVPQPVPVKRPRSVAAMRVTNLEGSSTRLRLVAENELGESLPEGFTTALLIDGDREGRRALFDHNDHQQRLGGERSCGRCHHRNLRLSRGTACATCHRDMYSCTDTFDHQSHVVAHGGNDGCRQCHGIGGSAKTRATALACDECHGAERNAVFAGEVLDPSSSPREISLTCMDCHSSGEGTVFASEPEPAQGQGIAPGYRWAMHRLCIGCHRATQAERKASAEDLTRCNTCHLHVSEEPPPPESRLALLRRTGDPLQ